MEKVIFISKAENVYEGAKGYSRIYFGEEFCENRIPEKEDYKLVYDYLKENNKEVSFVFPYLTDYGMDLLDEILDYVNPKAGTEIIANDWGTVYHLERQYPGVEVVVGRLLNKMKRDPRIKTAEKFLDKDMMEMYRSSNLLTESSIRLLESKGIKNIEFDCPMQGVKLKKTNFKYSVHYPLGYITTTRFCITNPATYKPGGNYRCTGKLCEKITLKEENEKFSCRVYQKGNTVFYYNNKVTKEDLFALGFNRVIEHKGL